MHIYLPKRISMGSAPQRGLQIEAEGVYPYHADLLYKDSMYWIQNCADAGEVQVCHHKLANNEMVALESGDTIDLGAARFIFEAF
jgi:predicted component of type VI protein secretion system